MKKGSIELNPILPYNNYFRDVFVLAIHAH